MHQYFKFVMKYLLKSWGFYVSTFLVYFVQIIILFVVPVLLHREVRFVIQESLLIGMCLLTTLIPACYLLVKLFKNNDQGSIDLLMVTKVLTKKQLILSKFLIVFLIGFMISLICAIFGWFSMINGGVNYLAGFGWFFGVLISFLFYSIIGLAFNLLLNTNLAVFLVLGVSISMLLYTTSAGTIGVSKVKSLKQNNLTLTSVNLPYYLSDGKATYHWGTLVSYKDQLLNQKEMLKNLHYYYLLHTSKTPVYNLYLENIRHANVKSVATFNFFNQFAFFVSWPEAQLLDQLPAGREWYALRSYQINPPFYLDFVPQQIDYSKTFNLSYNKTNYVMIQRYGSYLFSQSKMIDSVPSFYFVNNFHDYALLNLPIFKNQAMTFNESKTTFSANTYLTQLKTFIKQEIFNPEIERIYEVIKILNEPFINLNTVFVNMIFYNVLNELGIKDFNQLPTIKRQPIIKYFADQYYLFIFSCMQAFKWLASSLTSEQQAMLFSIFNIFPNDKYVLKEVVPLANLKTNDFNLNNVMQALKQKHFYLFNPSIYLITKDNTFSYLVMKVANFYNMTALVLGWSAFLAFITLIEYYFYVKRDIN